MGLAGLFSPSDAMLSTRPKQTRSHLTLDEQSFQGLLAAAFTIQEHNDQMKKARLLQTQSEVRPEPEAVSVCAHCGAPKAAEESRCQSCSLDKFRPGERLQRNWASMWLKSQEQQGRWAERPADVGEAPPEDGETQKAGASTLKAIPPVAGERRPLSAAARESASNGVLAWPVANDRARETLAPEITKKKAETIRDGALDDEGEWTTETSADLTREDLAPEESELAVQPLSLFENDLFENHDSSPPEAGDDATNFWQRFEDLRVKLHRADVYLAAAVLMAALALLWPTAGSPPRHKTLGPWQRALITLGIAEAPAPAIHLQGDPGIEVWVDPHTALYYCPGEEQYGKTADGRFSSQRDAQMDRFDPAGLSVCE